VSVGEITYDRVNEYSAIKIGLASRKTSQLVVRRSQKAGDDQLPHVPSGTDGLFCERIFGPRGLKGNASAGNTRHYEINKGHRSATAAAVKVTHSRVRRKRMGHIELAAPVVHIVFQSTAEPVGRPAHMKTTSLEKVIDFQDYVVTDPGDNAAAQMPDACGRGVPPGEGQVRAKGRSPPIWAPRRSRNCCRA